MLLVHLPVANCVIVNSTLYLWGADTEIEMKQMTWLLFFFSFHNPEEWYHDEKYRKLN